MYVTLLYAPPSFSVGIAGVCGEVLTKIYLKAAGLGPRGLPIPFSRTPDAYKTLVQQVLSLRGDRITLVDTGFNLHVGEPVAYDSKTNKITFKDGGNLFELDVSILDWGGTTRIFDPTKPDQWLNQSGVKFSSERFQSEFSGYRLNHYGDFPLHHLQVLNDYDLAPRFNEEAYRLKVRGATYVFGRPFSIDEGRIAIHFAIKPYNEGSFSLRTIYRSNSHALFKVLPAINLNPRLPRFDKGVAEESLTLPWEVNQRIAQLLGQDGANVVRSISSSQANAALAGGVPVSMITTIDSNNWFNKVDGKPYTITDEMIQRLNDPIDLRLENGMEVPDDSAPDFSRMIGSYQVHTSLSGSVLVRVYSSRNQQFEYEVMEELSTGRVWIAKIGARVGTVTSHGVLDNWVQTNRMDAPLWDYHSNRIRTDQSGPSQQHPQNPSYVLNWEAIVGSPLIQEWYRTNGRDIPN